MSTIVQTPLKDRPATRRKKMNWTLVLTYLLLLVGIVMMLLPLLWMVTTSLSNNVYATSFPPKFIPTVFDFKNYTHFLTDPIMGHYLINTLIYVVPGVFGATLSSCLAAYAFGRLHAPGKKMWFVILIATMMIPGEVTMIPKFIMFRYLHWTGTFLPLIVPTFFGGAYNIFLMRQFLMTIPTELDEAAKLDGLGYFGIWWRIIVPLSKPSIAAVAIFSFTWAWNDFMGPLIYLNDPKKYPLSLGVYMLSKTGNNMMIPQWNIVMAGAVIMTIPMLIVFFFGQKQIYEGSNMLGKIT